MSTMRLERHATRYLSVLIKLTLFGACLIYLFKGVEAEKLLSALGRFDNHKILVVLLTMSCGFFLMGVRLWDLANRACTLAQGVFASFYGFFVNTILPARLGELAKIVYLHKSAGIPASQSTEFVFWERFADLNVFLFLVVFGALAIGGPALAIPFFALAAVIWGLLITFSLRPGWAYRLVRYLPVKKVREFVDSFLQHLEVRSGSGRYVRLFFYSLLIWLEHMLEIFLIIYWLSGFDLTISQGLVVFALAITGFSLPLAPAGLGVTDSAIVFSLGLYGIGHNEALAASLIWRVSQYLITICVGLLVAFREGAGLKSLLRQRTGRGAVLGGGAS